MYICGLDDMRKENSNGCEVHWPGCCVSAHLRPIHVNELLLARFLRRSILQKSRNNKKSMEPRQCCSFKHTTVRTKGSATLHKWMSHGDAKHLPKAAIKDYLQLPGTSAGTA